MSESDREDDETTERQVRRSAQRASAALTLPSRGGVDHTDALDTGDLVDADALRSGLSITANPALSAFSVAPVRGERIGEGRRFEIVEKLGQGGMGHVFRAVDSNLDRPVAIKFILQSHGMPLEQLATLLKREAKATAKLNHENIVAIHDMDAYNGMPFLVMELLDGQSLDVMIERIPLSPLRATRVMAQVARGLMHAHANGIVHRDLKPSNVFILRDGRAKILDFGISRFERPLPALVPTDIAPTITGVGTPAFMAPEQWRSGPQDGRTDIWAAGVMFYQMLTGQLPYRVPELLRFKMNSRVRSVAPSARLLVPGLPEEADRIIATALNEEPEGRYQVAGEFYEALRELERVLAGHAVDSETVSGGAPLVERRPMTLLACALEGLEALELDDIVEADQRFYQLCADAVKRCGGSPGTPIGGRFFCCFGHPAVTETDAQRAVRAALEIAQAVRGSPELVSQGLSFRIGIHSGIVGLPNVPAAGAGVPAMQGNVPNLALRLCEHAGTNRVVMSQATFDLTSGLFHSERQADGAHWAGPRDTPVYEVLRELESGSRFEQAFAARTTPFVGRDAELRVLKQLWEEAKDGRGQVLVVSGDAGIGKSRLVQQLKEQVIDEQNVRLTCQCRPHYKNSALHPVIELVLRSMGIRRDDPPELKLEKAEQSLNEFGFSLAENLPLFASFLSIPLDARGPSDGSQPAHVVYAPLALSPEQQKLKTLEGLVSMLLRMALTRPTLFIVEDMHWVDHSTVEFLNALIDLVPATRLLVVLTCRPEFRAPWSARRHLHHLKLDRLSSAFTASMITRVSKERELPAEMIRQLVATTDGVPLFVEELTRMVLDSWHPTSDSWTNTPLAIPGTLHELLLARLDRLRGLGKDVAQLAAVLGRDFHYQLVRHVSTFDEMSLQQGLDLLVAAGLLHHQGKPPDAKYMFKHALIQQAAYQSLVKSERQRHHRRTAQVLTEVFSETIELEPELLAYHHAEAGNTSEAATFWEKAGQRATQRSALVEAIDHYTKARESLRALPASPERDRRELSLLLAVGSPLMSVHGYAAPEVEKTYARARELARSAGGQGELFPAMQGLWQFYYVRGMLPTSRALGEQLLEIAEEAGSSTFLLLAHRCVASSAFLQGDFESCRVHTDAGLRIYDPREHGTLAALRTGHDPGVAHGVYRAWTLWMLGFADQSADCVDRMIRLAERLEHPLTMAYALCFAALMRNHRGDHEIAKHLAEEALVITTENCFALWSAWARMQQGWALASLGNIERGIPLMREGLEGWKNTGARVGFTFFPVTLAEMCLHAGRLDDTEQLLDEALPMVQNNDEHFYEAELCRLKGELCLARRDDALVAEADAHFRRGIEVAREQRALSWELRCTMSRSRYLAAAGDGAAALSGLEAVCARFSEGFETADLRAAHEQIATLRARA
jgi:TOMM system kinase/cyclase fusion protein